MKIKTQIQNKRIVILGAGESGTGAALLAKKEGFDVFVSDFGEIKDKYKEELVKNNIEFEENQHTESEILKADEIIKSPGIPDSAKIIKKILAKNINIISEIEFAGRYTNAKTICITGSNGKTTTTLLTYYIMNEAGLNVGLAGNIGESFAKQVANKNFDYYVIELSSFQLDGMYNFKANIAILMNITPDHLDRYEHDFQQYVNSKFRIIQNQTSEDKFIYCADDDIILNEIEQRNINAEQLPFSVTKKYDKGAFLENKIINIVTNNNTFTMRNKDLALKGVHNTYNSMASGIVSRLSDIRSKILKEKLSDFKGVPHRLEKYIKVKGIQFINDSKATNVNSTWYALQSLEPSVILIIGGVDKGNDYSILKEAVSRKVKAIVCLGKNNTPIHKAFIGLTEIYDANSMEEAVKMSYSVADEGDTVLLSPSCASFDLFDNYEDRGNKFKESVRSL